MKKHLLILLLLVSSMSMAQDITVISSVSKSSPAGVFAMSLKESLNSSFYQASNCEDAIEKYKATPNSVFVYDSAYEFGARQTGLKCPLKGQATLKNTIFVGETYFNICRKTGNNNTLNAEANTLGMASMYATKAHEQTFNKAGANIKIIPYPGSKDVVLALRAGDISLGWIGSGMAKQQVEAGNFECQYSTNPVDKDYLGRALPKLAIPDYHIGYIVYTNAEEPAVKDKLKNIRNNDLFNNFLKTSQTSGTFDPTQKDIDGVSGFVDKMTKYWSDKK